MPRPARYYAPMPKRTEPVIHQPIRQVTPAGGCRAISLPFLVVVLLIGLAAMVAVVMITRDPQAFVVSVWVEQIGKTAIPDEQKQHMVGVIFDVRDRLAAGEITQQQAEAVAKAMNDPATGAAVNAALFYHVADRVQRRPEYPDRDPEPTSRQLQRMVRGVIEGAIPGKHINELAPLVSRNGRPKDTVTADELLTLHTRAQALADEAGVPDEPYEVDTGKLFEAAVNKALSEASTEPRP